MAFYSPHVLVKRLQIGAVCLPLRLFHQRVQLRNGEVALGPLLEYAALQQEPRMDIDDHRKIALKDRVQKRKPLVRPGLR